jgi:hypothetical protein
LGKADCVIIQWATFVNYLLPDHAAEVNNDVADRKLRAEVVEGIHQLVLSQGDQSRPGGSDIDAQLQHLRQPKSSNTTEWLGMAESTILEWNRGFFRPRGIQITIADQHTEIAAREDTRRNTIPWEAEMQPEATRNNRRAFLGLGRNCFIDAGPQGLRMEPITVSQRLPPPITNHIMCSLLAGK